MEDVKNPGDYVLNPGLRGLGIIRVAKKFPTRQLWIGSEKAENHTGNYLI